MTKLREARKARGLSLDEAAKLLGTSKGRLSDIERGSSCSMRFALRLVRFYGGRVTLDDIAQAISDRRGAA